MLQNWESKLIEKFLFICSNILSNRGCNDTPQEIIDLIPKEVIVAIDKYVEDHNETPEEHDPENPTAHYCDWLLCAYLALRVKEETSAK